MEARCREHAVDSPAALPLYLEAGFLLCLHSWLVRHQRRVAAGRSRIPITCPLGSLPKPSMCLGRPGNLSLEDAGLLSCSVKMWMELPRP